MMSHLAEPGVCNTYIYNTHTKIRNETSTSREDWISEFTEPKEQGYWILTLMMSPMASLTTLTIRISKGLQLPTCVILQLTEYWRRALDENKYVGTIAMDLSKAFDCMPHGLLLAILHSYGLSSKACIRGLYVVSMCINS